MALPSSESNTAPAFPLYTFEEWIEVLSPRLRRLISEAEEQRWPFIPEEWQFDASSDTGSVNVKDLIMSSNKRHPKVTEKDVLVKCLEEACEQKRFKLAAAVAFVLDRFMYWLGTSKYIIDKVEFIRKIAPTTPIAPQMIIRKARVLKDGGSLQSAERTVDYIIYDKRHRDQWHYVDEAQYERTRITCVLMKGVIRHNLGLWLESADLVFETIIGYNELPEHDLKGVASSLCYVSDIIRNMSRSDYRILQTKYELQNDEPLMEAYAANRQAAWLCRYEPFFVAGHQRRAGEVMLMYAVAQPTGQRLPSIEQALEDLKTGLTAHNTFTSLRSQQQLYEFSFTLYQVVVAYVLINTESAIEMASQIEEQCMIVYKYLSAATESVSLDGEFRCAVNNVMALLDLNLLREEGKAKENPFVDMAEYGYVYPSYKEGMKDVKLSSTRRRPDGTTIIHLKSKEDNSTGSRSITIADPSATTVLHSLDKAKSIPESPWQSSADSGNVRGATPPKRHSLAMGQQLPEDRINSLKNDHNLEEDQGIGIPRRDESMACLDCAPLNVSDELAVVKGRNQAECIQGRQPEQVNLSASLAIPLSVDGADPGHDAADTKGRDTEGDRVESVLSVHSIESKDTTLSQVPMTFLSLDYSNPISSFSDPSLSSALGEELREIDVPLGQRIQLEEKEGEHKQFSKAGDLKVPSLTVPLKNMGEDGADISVVGESNTAPAATGTSGNVERQKRRMGQATIKPIPVHRARVFKYDPQHHIWNCLSTLVYVGKELAINKKGALRDVFELRYLNQDEPRGRYVGKRYRRSCYHNLRNYYQDVLCQMTARHYVAQFNKKLTRHPYGWQIQFLPAVHIQLLSENHRDIVDAFNVEPYVEGSDFVKVTNNYKYVNSKLDKQLIEISLAFMHFTYVESRGKLLVTDLQGWLPQDQAGIIIFTDPAIHSDTLKCFETANLGANGLEAFWKYQHPKCNAICQALGLNVQGDGFTR